MAARALVLAPKVYGTVCTVYRCQSPICDMGQSPSLSMVDNTGCLKAGLRSPQNNLFWRLLWHGLWHTLSILRCCSLHSPVPPLRTNSGHWRNGDTKTWARDSMGALLHNLEFIDRPSLACVFEGKRTTYLHWGIPSWESPQPEVMFLSWSEKTHCAKRIKAIII